MTILQAHSFGCVLFFVPFVPSVSLSQWRDTRDSGTLSRQWDSLDEPSFCDWSQVEAVYQAVDPVDFEFGQRY